MAIVSYSQNREDVLLNRVFPDDPGGFYIDVGAGDPVCDSVTKLFYDRGWHGINIEPVPTAFEALARDRIRDINLPIGLSNCEGTLAFHEFPRVPGFSTFSMQQAERHRRAGYEAVEHSIPVTTLARVCERHDVPTISFLKIDVEGHEREVLEGADWGRFRPRVVVVEATRPGTNIPNHEEWEDLLLAADYLFACFDGLNRYYVRAEDRELLPQLAVPVNVFDDYLLYDHHRHIQKLHRAIEATQQCLEATRAARDAAHAGLVEAHHALAGMQRALHDSQGALQGARAQLEAARAELAPFQELGPIAVGVARRLRRMSSHSPRLASMAKWMIRHVHSRARAPLPDA